MAAINAQSGLVSCVIGEHGDTTNFWPLSIQSKVTLTPEHEPLIVKDARGIGRAEFDGEFKMSCSIEAMDFPMAFCARFAGAVYTPEAASSTATFTIIEARGPSAVAARALIAALTLDADAEPGLYYWELTRSTAVLRRIDKGEDTELASMAVFTDSVGSRTSLVGTDLVFFSVQQMHEGGGEWTGYGLNKRPRFYCIATTEQPTTGKLVTTIIRKMVPKAMSSEMEALTIASGTAEFTLVDNDVTTRDYRFTAA